MNKEKRENKKKRKMVKNNNNRKMMVEMATVINKMMMRMLETNLFIFFNQITIKGNCFFKLLILALFYK